MSTLTGSSRMTRDDNTRTVTALLFEHLVTARHSVDSELMALGLDPTKVPTAAITVTVEVEVP